MNSPLPPFGPRLRSLIEGRGLTQKEVAAAAGMSQANLSGLISRRGVRVSLTTLHRLADALGLSLDELVGREPPARSRPRRPPSKQGSAV